MSDDTQLPTAAPQVSDPGTAAPDTPSPAAPPAASQPLEHALSPVKGMHCAACSSRIERVVGQMPGVRHISVNLATETMDVAWDPGATDFKAIAEQVKDLGFEADEPKAETTMALDIKGMHCAACSSRIERVIGGMEGVSRAEVNLATESGRFSFDPAHITRRAIRQAIEELGFTSEVREETGGITTRRQEAEARLAAQRGRLIPALIFAGLVLVLSMGHMLGMPLPAFLDPVHAPLAFALTQLALTLPVIWFSRSFYLVGFPALVRRAPNMDSLIAVGTGAALVYSIWNTVEIAMGIDPMAKAMDLYFESAAVLLGLISLGKYFEARSKLKTSDAISKLMELSPDVATLMVDGEQRVVPAGEVEPGDVLLIKPGERVPVDGIVLTGESHVDESMLTGEPMPVAKHPGDSLTGGTLNTTTALTMRTERVGSETTLARIIRLVQEAQGSKAPIASLADQVSYYFVPAVMAAAVLAGLGWYFIGGAHFTFALRIFIAVMVIACPCAMGLAVPTSIMVGTGRGAQLGVLVKSGAALQAAETVNVVVFDKTGTLTHGRPELTDVLLAGDWQEDDLLALAAGAESASEHPLATAVVGSAKERGVVVRQAASTQALPGRGVRAEVPVRDKVHEGDEVRTRSVLIGNTTLMSETEVPLSAKVLTHAETLASQGKTPLYVAVDGRFAGVLAVADPIKADTPRAVKQLRDMGVEVIMLTGDTEATAKAIARSAGIGRVIAGVLPERKAAEITALQDGGATVAMVGDGINDAPALAQADVGIAMGSGIDVAVETGDVVLMHDDPESVVTALALARAVMRNIRQNLFWAFAYNVVGIPVAAGVLFAFGGPTLNPMLAGTAMALSSVSVVSNALRLRFFRSPVARSAEAA